MILINRYIWAVATVLILYSGLYYSIKLNGVQFKFKSMFKSLFYNSGNVSSIGLLMTSLAGRIGVGSIAGVALSIYVGGEGTIFWMWISTLFCAVITYVEVVLGVKYKVKKENYGGPSYYIRDGLKNKSLAALFSILLIISYIGCFLAIQSNTIYKSIVQVLPFSPYIVGLCISVITFFCIYGGFKTIVDVSTKLVPIMSIIYVGSALIISIINYDIIGNIFFSIISKAFNVKSFFGGFLPMVIMGIQRGIFSNEAGIGTSGIVGASSDDENYLRIALTQMLGVYVTTLVICTATALILLTSNYTNTNLIDINGIELMWHAFKYHFGTIGVYILLISVVLFSFSTIVTGYYYGEASFNYFFDVVNKKYIYILRSITLIIIFFGCIISSSILWAIVDILVGIMVIINLYAMWKLRNKI